MDSQRIVVENHSQLGYVLVCNPHFYSGNPIISTFMDISCGPLSTPLRVLAVEMQGDDDVIGRRLMELGFIQGAIVEIRHHAPFTADPIAVMVRGMVVALRRYEAKRVRVEPEHKCGKTNIEQAHL